MLSAGHQHSEEEATQAPAAQGQEYMKTNLRFTDRQWDVPRSAQQVHLVQPPGLQQRGLSGA